MNFRVHICTHACTHTQKCAYIQVCHSIHAHMYSTRHKNHPHNVCTHRQHIYTCHLYMYEYILHIMCICMSTMYMYCIHTMHVYTQHTINAHNPTERSTEVPPKAHSYQYASFGPSIPLISPADCLAYEQRSEDWSNGLGVIK